MDKHTKWLWVSVISLFVVTTVLYIIIISQLLNKRIATEEYVENKLEEFITQNSVVTQDDLKPAHQNVKFSTGKNYMVDLEHGVDVAYIVEPGNATSKLDVSKSSRSRITVLLSVDSKFTIMDGETKICTVDTVTSQSSADIKSGNVIVLIRTENAWYAYAHDGPTFSLGLTE